MMAGRRVRVLNAINTSIENVVKGIVSYTASYLTTLDYTIERKVDGNDIVITIRIKNVAQYFTDTIPNET